MPIDPVCKMTVDKRTPAATSEHNGATYYFCAQGCKLAFDENSEKYLNEEGRISRLARLNPFTRRDHAKRESG